MVTWQRERKKEYVEASAESCIPKSAKLKNTIKMM